MYTFLKVATYILNKSIIKFYAIYILDSKSNWYKNSRKIMKKIKLFSSQFTFCALCP